MSEIAPCITANDEADFKKAVETLKPFAKRVHIDISDGQFAPVQLMPADKLWWPQEWTVDIHTMVNQPSKYIDHLVSLKPSMITMHVEAGENIEPLISRIKQFNIRVGVAIMRPTVPSSVADIIKIVDHVMIFSGNLGHYGGVASMMQLEKVRLIKAINPNVEIGWDGGVSMDNAFQLAQGGVDVLNTGSGISQAGDPGTSYTALTREINKTGVI
jgi:ribulose-phosphate 3-epimerase